jgi:hypothetical protein
VQYIAFSLWQVGFFSDKLIGEADCNKDAKNLVAAVGQYIDGAQCNVCNMCWRLVESMACAGTQSCSESYIISRVAY